MNPLAKLALTKEVTILSHQKLKLVQRLKFVGAIVIIPWLQWLNIDRLNASNLTIPISSHSIQNRTASIDLNKISIGGIAMGMSERAVTAKLGKPKQRKFERNNACTGSDLITLIYPGMTINLDTHDRQTHVYSILVTSARYQTNRGVSIGNSIERARKIYPLQFDRYTHQWLSIASKDPNYLVFSIDKKGQIEEISLGTLVC
jgi:hypothetical protein